MTGRVVVDTSVYIDVLRDRAFAATFRPLYERGIPRTHLSSVVVQELLAGARTAAHRRLAQALVEPFERARRVVTPTHPIWRDTGDVLSALWRDHFHCDEGFAWAIAAHVAVSIGARGLYRGEEPGQPVVVLYAVMDDPR